MRRPVRRWVIGLLALGALLVDPPTPLSVEAARVLVADRVPRAAAAAVVRSALAE